MIPPIRIIASAIEDQVSDDPTGEELGECSSDPEIDILVRHAVHQELVAHEAGHIWQKLSRRVKGPFGNIAVEEPAMRGQSMPVIATAGETPDRRPDSMRHSLFRTAEATFSMR